jgi:hypothetical protein
LSGLAKEGQAPSFLGIKSRFNVPVYSVVASILPPLLGYASVASVGSKNVLIPYYVQDLMVGLRPFARIVDNERGLFVVSDMRYISPFSTSCSLARSKRCNAAEGAFALSTFPRVVWTHMVCFVESDLLIRASLTEVFLNDYDVFTCHNSLWSTVATSWGYYLSPWMMIAVLLLTLFGWFIYEYIVRREWGLQIPSYWNADVTNGISPPVAEREWRYGYGIIMKTISWIVDHV